MEHAVRFGKERTPFRAFIWIEANGYAETPVIGIQGNMDRTRNTPKNIFTNMAVIGCKNMAVLGFKDECGLWVSHSRVINIIKSTLDLISQKYKLNSTTNENLILKFCQRHLHLNKLTSIELYFVRTTKKYCFSWEFFWIENNSVTYSREMDIIVMWLNLGKMN